MTALTLRSEGRTRRMTQIADACRSFIQILAACVLLTLNPAHGLAESTPYARVIVESATVRSGPGAGFRSVYLARYGEIFPIRRRSTQGYFLQISLPDSTLGWIAGDTVYGHAVSDESADDEPVLGWLFAPPPLSVARGEVALTGGVLGGGGMIAIKPSILLDPAFGFEFTGAAVVARGGRLLLASFGPIVNLFPKSPIVPFATVQGGVTASSPNADTFLLESGAIATASAGFGLRFGFHHRITLRIETRTHVFFEPDRMLAEEEFCAGLTVFF